MTAAEHRAQQMKLAGLSLATFRIPFWNSPWFRRQGYSPIPILEEVGAEGFASGARNEVAAIAKQDPVLFERVVEFGVLTSKLPQYRNATDHLLLVGRS
jgi:hypothetical protein